MNGPPPPDPAATTPDDPQGLGATLGLLSAIDAGEDVTQRGLARHLGVALGLANALVKRCVTKGLVKVSEAPTRRYMYYLTPKGFSEKSRLTAEYLRVSLGFFRRARTEYGEAFAECRERGWTRVAAVGAGELAEIASLAAQEHEIELVAVIDRGLNTPRFHGIPVHRTLVEAGPVDAVVLTEPRKPQETFDALLLALPAERIFAPRLLHVSRGGFPRAARLRDVS
jgi:DNA-binding MarR family transcriptional regulator